jgi:hypothetical protein
MSFDAKAITVMIASPGDVQQERRFIRDVIHNWNDLNARDRGCVLLPVGWETHSAPALGERPQQLINERVLRDCDLLVGVFWTRLGTPTGESASGTVEEIEKHLAAGKPAMVYFSEQPVAPESLDLNQYAALQEFKSWCLSKGLISTYQDVVDFRESFTRHLQINLRDDPYLRPLQRSREAGSDSSAQDDADEHFLSEESKTLLLAAAEDSQGLVLVHQALDGDTVLANRVNFAEGADARRAAAWRSAVAQLEFNMFIEDRGGKGQVYYVTDTGFRYAERLKNAQD